MILRFITLLMLVIMTGTASAQVRVEYVVSLKRPQTQTVEIAMHMRGLDSDTTVLAMPVWRPGRYSVLDPASGIRWIRAENLAGDPIAIEKTSPSSWVIEHPGERGLTVRYELYANEFSLRTRHIDDTHAFLSGSSVFLYVPELRDDKLTVRIDAPQGWRTATGLRQISPGIYEAPNYDMLVDAPFEIGMHDVFTFEVEGVQHEVVKWGHAEVDATKLKSDLSALVAAQMEFFGGLPYERYVFIVHVQPGARGGTEHYNSTIMQTSPESFRSRAAYLRFLSLSSHELFHTWNVKRFRPMEIARYDYQSPSLTPSLWLVEGTTSYYDGLLLVRAGLMKPSEYFERLAGTINAYLSRPGREIKSLAEASVDAWLEFGRPSPDRENASVDFYAQGALTSLVIDAQIRLYSRGERSLDDVMRALNDQFPFGSAGYTAKDIVRLASEAAGRDMTPVFEAHVTGTEELSLGSALGVYGLELVVESKPTAWEKERGVQPRETRADLGLRTSAGDIGARVTAALENGPSFSAGLIAGDEIIAINGRRVRGGDLSSALEGVEPGASVALVFFRRDELRTLAVRTQAVPSGVRRVRLMADSTDEQRAMLADWLGTEAAKEIAERSEDQDD